MPTNSPATKKIKMGLFGKIATLASVAFPPKPLKTPSLAAPPRSHQNDRGHPSPPPPPGAGGAGGGTATKTKTMTGGTGGLRRPHHHPPPPKAGQNVYAAGANFKKTKPAPVNVWAKGKK